MTNPTAHARLTSYLRATGWDAPERPSLSGGLWPHSETGLGLPAPTAL